MDTLVTRDSDHNQHHGSTTKKDKKKKRRLAESTDNQDRPQRRAKDTSTKLQ